MGSRRESHKNPPGFRCRRVVFLGVVIAAVISLVIARPPISSRGLSRRMSRQDAPEQRQAYLGTWPNNTGLSCGFGMNVAPPFREFDPARTLEIVFPQ